MAFHEAKTEEKRLSARFPLSVPVRGSLPYELHGPYEVTLQCVTENIGGGGAQILSNQRLPPGAIIRCVFGFSDSRAAIPTLMKVRWSARIEETPQYKSGLQFLI